MLPVFMYYNTIISGKVKSIWAVRKTTVLFLTALQAPCAPLPASAVWRDCPPEEGPLMQQRGGVNQDRPSSRALSVTLVSLRVGLRSEGLRHGGQGGDLFTLRGLEGRISGTPASCRLRRRSRVAISLFLPIRSERRRRVQMVGLRNRPFGVAQSKKIAAPALSSPTAWRLSRSFAFEARSMPGSQESEDRHGFPEHHPVRGVRRMAGKPRDDRLF